MGQALVSCSLKKNPKKTPRKPSRTFKVTSCSFLSRGEYKPPSSNSRHFLHASVQSQLVGLKMSFFYKVHQQHAQRAFPLVCCEQQPLCQSPRSRQLRQGATADSRLKPPCLAPQQAPPALTACSCQLSWSIPQDLPWITWHQNEGCC